MSASFTSKIRDILLAALDNCHYLDDMVSSSISSMTPLQLSEINLFAGMGQEPLTLLTRMAVACEYDQDDTVFDQDEFAAYLYIIQAGEVAIRFTPYDGPPITVARIGVGEVFGWSSVLGRSVYTSAAICVQPTQVIRFFGKDLLRFCEAHPDTGIIIMERLAAVVADRLTQTNEQILAMLTAGTSLKRNEVR